MSRKSKRRIPLSCLGPAALQQLRAAGFAVDQQLQREQAAVRRKQDTGVPFNKFGVSAREQRTLDGIVFASKLEMTVYRFLKINSIPFTRQPEIVLQEAFEHEGKKIRPVRYIGDFEVKLGDVSYLIDTKGVRTPLFAMKEKLLLRMGRPVCCIQSIGQLLTLLRTWGWQGNLVAV